MKIAIDIGHANHTGATGNGLEEHEIAARIGNFTALLLRTNGREVNVIDYPQESNSTDLNKTIIAANMGCYDFGVSIHCDASDNKEAKGASVLFYPGSVQGSKLAVCVAEPLCRMLPGRANSVISRPGLAVLKKTKSPWVLVECGFITNKHDSVILRDHPEQIANAIKDGILSYINLNN